MFRFGWIEFYAPAQYVYINGELYSGYFQSMEWFEQPEQALDTPENGMDLC